jgi:hypothetical protein
VDENFSGTSLFINNKKLEQEYIKAFGWKWYVQDR